MACAAWEPGRGEEQQLAQPVLWLATETDEVAMGAEGVVLAISMRARARQLREVTTLRCLGLLHVGVAAVAIHPHHHSNRRGRRPEGEEEEGGTRPHMRRHWMAPRQMHRAPLAVGVAAAAARPTALPHRLQAGQSRRSRRSKPAGVEVEVGLAQQRERLARGVQLLAR
jgi:hypothetical protein